MDFQVQIERAFLLLRQGRTHDAAAESRQILAQDPNHALALGVLSTCNVVAKEYASALDFAKRAVAVEPDNAWLLFILARAQFFNKEIENAKVTINTGLEVDPEYATFWELRSEIALYEEHWEEALFAAEQGLALEPDDVDLINLRTRSLVQLNRTGEAEETIDFALNKSPEDPYSHANRGWVMVEQDRYDDAIEAFREALRLDPNLAHARSGLKEAIKGKNWLYRGVLKYFLWMEKLQSGARWAVIIGLYFASRVLRGLSNLGGWFGYVASTLLALYVIFVYSTWIGKPVGNLFLRFHPLGKLALDDDEKRGSNWIGGLLAGGVLLLLASLLMPETAKEQVFILGMVCIMMLIPVGGVFSVDEHGKSRKYLSWYAAALAVLALLGIFVEPNLIFVAALGLFFYGWVANYFIEKDARAF